MDATEKRLYRRYLTSQDSEDHAALISHAMRAGHIKEDRVALCAYLKDPVCAGLFFDFVRTGCFLYFDHAMGNREPADVFPHIRKWGTEATIRMGCGVIKALAKRNYKKEPKWICDIDAFANIAHTYRRFPRIANTLDELNERRSQWNKESIGIAAFARDYKVKFGLITSAARAFNSLLTALKNGWPYPGLGPLRIANGFLDDSAMWSAMVEYIKPWALGEYA